MMMINTPTVQQVAEYTHGYIARYGRPVWTPRLAAYWKAYSRRLTRERNAGENPLASDCLLTLSGRMMDAATD